MSIDPYRSMFETTHSQMVAGMDSAIGKLKIRSRHLDFGVEGGISVADIYPMSNDIEIYPPEIRYLKTCFS